MPVPDFNSSGVIPPHLGDPTILQQISPYPVSSLEVCEKFSFSEDRRIILLGWLELRAAIRLAGYTHGFQWLDGSFLEDVENRQSRSPGDIDVVSFLHSPSAPVILPPTLTDHDATKNQFNVDHFVVPLNWNGEIIVEHSRFWCGLFSHRREDGVWKGMLRVDLGTNADDDEAVRHLNLVIQP
jgi:hypothetical protein